MTSIIAPTIYLKRDTEKHYENKKIFLKKPAREHKTGLKTKFGLKLVFSDQHWLEYCSQILTSDCEIVFEMSGHLILTYGRLL